MYTRHNEVPCLYFHTHVSMILKLTIEAMGSIPDGQLVEYTPNEESSIFPFKQDEE